MAQIYLEAKPLQMDQFLVYILISFCMAILFILFINFCSVKTTKLCSIFINSSVSCVNLGSAPCTVILFLLFYNLISVKTKELLCILIYRCFLVCECVCISSFASLHCDFVLSCYGHCTLKTKWARRMDNQVGIYQGRESMRNGVIKKTTRQSKVHITKEEEEVFVMQQGEVYITPHHTKLYISHTYARQSTHH